MRIALIILLVPLVIFLAVFTLWFWPKSHALDIHPSYVGYYRGLGLEGAGDIFFGKNYYRVEITDDYGGISGVAYRHPGYNDFKGFYKTGVIREEGKCFVEVMGFHEQPYPDLHDVAWGKYYKPDGALGSEVRDGSGVQTYWTPAGIKIWELELKDLRRARLSWWYPNGQLLVKHKYVNGLQDGPFVSYYPSGTKKTEGAYTAGERSGKWIRYNEDGSIKETEDYTGASE